MAHILAALTGLSLIFGIIAAGTIWRGWVLSVVWGWLIVPIFAIAPISVVGAISISLVVSFLTYQHSTAMQDPEKAKFANAVGIMVFYPALVLFIAWIVKMFI